MKETTLEQFERIWSEMELDEGRKAYLRGSLLLEALQVGEYSDETVRQFARAHLLWYGLGDALLNYVAWEKEQI